MNLLDIFQTIAALFSVGGVLYLGIKNLPHETKNTDAMTVNTALDATDKALNLNKKYVDKILSLDADNTTLKQKMAELAMKVEAPQKYRLAVEFQTSTPPQVDKVEITPVDIEA